MLSLNYYWREFHQNSELKFVVRTDDYFMNVYGEKIDILLQRAPYFYLESQKNKDFCKNLENFLTQKNKNSKKLDLTHLNTK